MMKNNSKPNCFYIAGNESKIKKIKKPYKGYCSSDFNNLILRKAHNKKIPEYVGLLLAAITVKLDVPIAMLLQFAGRYLSYYLLVFVVIVLIDKSLNNTLSRQQILGYYKEVDPQRIIINMANGKNLEIIGDDKLLNNIVSWINS